MAIKPLKKYVQERQEGRKRRARYVTRERGYINARYQDLITSLAHSYKSPKGRGLLSEIKAHGFFLRLFLGREEHFEKEQAKALHKAIHKQLKSEGLVCVAVLAGAG